MIIGIAQGVTLVTMWFGIPLSIIFLYLESEDYDWLRYTLNTLFILFIITCFIITYINSY